jgi:type IV secretory pathway VirB2 component (pilin)
MATQSGKLASVVLGVLGSIKAFGFHAAHLAAGHVAAYPLYGLLLGILLWIWTNSAMVIAVVGVILGVWSVAIGVAGRPGWRRRRSSVFSILTNLASAACVLVGISMLWTQQRQVASNLVLPQGWVDRLIEFVSSGREDWPLKQRALLVELHSLLNRNPDHRGTAKVEFTQYDPLHKVLRLESDNFACGWTPDVFQRVYRIPGHTPGGGQSIAGRAWISGEEQYHPEAYLSPDFGVYEDEADRTLGRTVLVYSVPVIAANQSKPFGVLSITCSVHTKLSQHERDLVRAAAKALAEFHAKLTEQDQVSR